MALSDDVPDIFPFAIWVDSTVARHRSVRPGSTLLGKSAICQVILTKHLDVNAEFADLGGGEGALKDVVGFSIEATDGNIEETHVAVG